MRLRERLTGTEIDAVLDLAAAAAAADGVGPLSEQVRLGIRDGGPPGVRHLLRRERDDRGDVVGYAQLDLDAAPWPVGELAVAPAARRRGHGRALLDALLAASPTGRLRVWAHGDLPAARGLVAAAGFQPVRELRQLRRPLDDLDGRRDDAAPPAPPPPDVRLRTFVPGQDEQAWLALNARAFADHPEQGRWTEADLRRRMAEPWFDPAGFFLAEQVGGPRAGALLGFHWTKTHPAGGDGGDEPVGEVYVVGVDQAAQGGGLGRALTAVGLRHLAGRGLRSAMLYVDGDNTAAITLYTRLGFRVAVVDVMYGK